jgi:hypothetical protein
VSERLRRLAPGLGVVMWAASVGALALLMWAWMGADRLARWHGVGVAGMHAGHLEGIGLVAVVAFVGLQMAALLVSAWGLRVRFGMRVPVSFAASGAAMMGGGWDWAGGSAGLAAGWCDLDRDVCCGRERVSRGGRLRRLDRIQAVFRCAQDGGVERAWQPQRNGNRNGKGQGEYTGPSLRSG